MWTEDYGVSGRERVWDVLEMFIRGRDFREWLFVCCVFLE